MLIAQKIVKSGLGRPLPLKEPTIQKEVDGSSDWSSASVFVLGGIRKGADGKLRFHIKKVSHVDGDLGKELRKFIGKYSGFRFKFSRSTRNAYDKECQIYHQFKPIKNIAHPTRPRHTKYVCPVVDCKECD